MTNYLNSIIVIANFNAFLIPVIISIDKIRFAKYIDSSHESKHKIIVVKMAVIIYIMAVIAAKMVALGNIAKLYFDYTN